MGNRGLSRRLFLRRAASAVLTLGAAPLIGLRTAHSGHDPYASGLWLSGDHHLHTQYSIDGLYAIDEQVQSAVRGGLDFCVITDHGGPGHQRVLLSRAYRELVEARRRHPEILVFQGLEWNIPAAEHGSIIVPPTADEADLIAEFESRFDSRTTAQTPHPASSEADAIAGVRYLEARAPSGLFIANHPSRRGLDSPHELRAWAAAGPTVMRGIEGAPGHGAATLAGIARGYYGETPDASAFAGYPLHAYRTWGGYDYAVAQVGGLWDSLLGEGRAFYITANSDAHRYVGDHSEVDRATYKTLGYVTRTGRNKQPDRHNADEDFLPGAYARTYVHAKSRQPLAILDAMRGGNMWTVQGGLVDGVELFLHDRHHAAPMGSTLLIERGAEVEMVLRLRLASRPNLGGQVPTLHHVDVIVGDILPASDPDRQYHPSARIAARLTPPVAPPQASGQSPWVELRYRLPRVDRSFFLRVRGTNSDFIGPRLDPLGISPFADLWFYSNPVLVRC